MKSITVIKSVYIQQHGQKVNKKKKEKSKILKTNFLSFIFYK